MKIGNIIQHLKSEVKTTSTLKQYANHIDNKVHQNMVTISVSLYQRTTSLILLGQGLILPIRG